MNDLKFMLAKKAFKEFFIKFNTIDYNVTFLKNDLIPSNFKEFFEFIEELKKDSSVFVDKAQQDNFCKYLPKPIDVIEAISPLSTNVQIIFGKTQRNQYALNVSYKIGHHIFVKNVIGTYFR